MKMEDPMCRTKTQHSQINKQVFLFLFFFKKQEKKKREKDKQGGKGHRKISQSTILSDIVEN